MHIVLVKRRFFLKNKNKKEVNNLQRKQQSRFPGAEEPRAVTS